jgi:hypothetical protein
VTFSIIGSRIFYSAVIKSSSSKFTVIKSSVDGEAEELCMTWYDLNEEDYTSIAPSRGPSGSSMDTEFAGGA